jgi:hypothetical protein
MLRFPNPGSTTSNFVAVYRAAFERLHGKVVGLDDIVAATVAANLATSSGYMGAEAIARSTRDDRSRDPLYNQLKMYAELFRAHGWLHPTERSALNYTFTLLGRQLVAAGPHFRDLFAETVLGIAYPSHVLTVKGNYDLRPFAFLLRVMLACDGALSRDEMIVGPLDAASDRGADAAAKMAAVVGKLRESADVIEKALGMVSAQRRIQTNTLKNYTRWPIAIMRDCGWTEKARMRFRSGGGSFEVHALTAKGREVAQWLESAADLRVDQVDALPLEEKAALSIAAHYTMLDRAGFDISPVQQKLTLQEPALQSARARLGIRAGQAILFSPFQSLSISETRKIFAATEEARTTTTRTESVGGHVMGRGSRDHLFVEPKFVAQAAPTADEADSLAAELKAIRAKHRSAKEAAAAFAVSRASDTRTQFYPLVSHLFRLLGFKSDYSRLGVNYQRWDAAVWLDSVAVPIEIKSPTEEAFLSTKAIRQALENKVVLLARGGLETRREMTSLIVGYQIPNERGDMSSLIDDIDKAFGFKIGVIDLATLALLALTAIVERVTIEAAQLGHLRGFLNV